MRAVVLSDETNIKFLNKHFINTWVTNSELGRTSGLLIPIAQKNESESKKFNISHPLVNAIIHGTKTGSKKDSPVDCFIISPELKLMGRQHVNEYLAENRIKGILSPAPYLTFLKKSLRTEFPGLGHIVLNCEEPTQEHLNIFQTPPDRSADYTVVVIDTRTFKEGGTLTINLEVGKADGEGWFDLFTDNMESNTKESMLEDPLVSTWIQPGDTGKIIYRFDYGQIFKLGATGAWHNEKGSVNAFYARISVD